MVKRTHEMGKAGLSIPAVLKENKLLTPYRFFQAKRDWPQIIGKQIAKYSYIKDIDKNCQFYMDEPALYVQSGNTKEIE